MFDGGNLGLAFLQRRCHAGIADDGRLCRQFHYRIKVDATEHDAGIHRGRVQCQFYLGAGMQADANGLD
ncbi:hypothetical protein D3C81_1929000 [compost metagenome]